MTIVPTILYFKHSLVKIEIALGKGKSNTTNDKIKLKKMCKEKFNVAFMTRLLTNNKQSTNKRLKIRETLSY